MAKIVRIMLTMLVRKEKIVTVEVPDDLDLTDEAATNELMSNVYEQDEGYDFVNDTDWGCEEGTHSLLGEADKSVEPDFRMDDKGVFEITD